MESGRKKGVKLKMKSGKGHRTKEKKLTNKKKEYLKRTKKLSETI